MKPGSMVTHSETQAAKQQPKEQDGGYQILWAEPESWEGKGVLAFAAHGKP